MTKETEFKGYLEKHINHFKGRYGKSDNIIDKLKADIFKQALNRFQNEGWDKTYEWVKNQYDKFSGEHSRLSRNLAGGCKQVRDKMWSLARKENKG